MPPLALLWDRLTRGPFSKGARSRACPPSGQRASFCHPRSSSAARTSHWTLVVWYPGSGCLRQLLHRFCHFITRVIPYVPYVPYVLKSSVASPLSEFCVLADSTVSSSWLPNESWEIRGYPAEGIVMQDLDIQARPSRGVACPPQWLPLLLTTALPSPPPPSPSPRPPSPPPLSPPPPSDPPYVQSSEFVILISAVISAVVLLVLCCRRILRDRADRADLRDRANRHASRRAKRRADRRAKRHDLQMTSRQVQISVQTRTDVSALPDSLPAQHPASLTGARATPRRGSWSGAMSIPRRATFSTDGRVTLPPGPPSSSWSLNTSWSAGLSNRTARSRQASLSGLLSNRAVNSRPTSCCDPLSNRTVNSPTSSCDLLSNRTDHSSRSLSPPDVHALQAAPASATAFIPGTLAAPFRADAIAPMATIPLAAPTAGPPPSPGRANSSAAPMKRPAQPDSATAPRAKRAFTSPCE